MLSDIEILYKSKPPTCDPNDAPMNHSTTIVDWQQSLESLTGTMSCTQGYSLTGTSDVACNAEGELSMNV